MHFSKTPPQLQWLEKGLDTFYFAWQEISGGIVWPSYGLFTSPCDVHLMYPLWQNGDYRIYRFIGHKFWCNRVISAKWVLDFRWLPNEIQRSIYNDQALALEVSEVLKTFHNRIDSFLKAVTIPDVDLKIDFWYFWIVWVFRLVWILLLLLRLLL